MAAALRQVLDPGSAAPPYRPAELKGLPSPWLQHCGRFQIRGARRLPTGHQRAGLRRARARRHAFKHIVERSSVLTNILGKSGPGRVMNMDNLLLRESMDVIGRVGFEKEMGALEDFMEGDVGSGASVDVMLRCTHEARPAALLPFEATRIGR